MRLNKYLKVPGFVKHHALAKEIDNQGRVTVNGNVARAGTDVKVEGKLVTRLGQKSVTVKITELSEHASKENAESMYELIKEERVQPSVQPKEV